MQYSITDIRFEPSDLDDEVLAIEFRVCLTEPEEVQFSSFVTLSDLLNYARQHHPAFYQYWQSTRRRTDRFGPAEAATLELAGDSAVIQLISFLKEYISIHPWMEHEYAHFKKIQALKSDPENSGALEAMASDLADSAEGVREEQQRYRQFCEQVTREVRKVATQLYPEIEEMDSEKLLEFQHLFVNEVISMERRLCEFLRE
jgi:hypothetical protein